jgi:hypothetical protein
MKHHDANAQMDLLNRHVPYINTYTQTSSSPCPEILRPPRYQHGTAHVMWGSFIYSDKTFVGYIDCCHIGERQLLLRRVRKLVANTRVGGRY